MPRAEPTIPRRTALQQPPWPSLLAACVAGIAAPALGQEADSRAGSSARAWVVQSGLTLRETVTNNRNVDSSDKRADAITEVSPSVHVDGRSSHVRAALDYAPSLVLYARGGAHNEIQNNLSAALNAEVWDNHAFVDARASVTQQNVSAYRSQSTNTALVDDNRSEVASLSLAPSLRGDIYGIVDVVAQAGYTVTRASSTQNGDTDSFNAGVTFSGGRARLGWSVELSHRSYDFDVSRKTTEDNARLRLTTSPGYDLRLGAIGGVERTDAETGVRQTHNRWGGTLDWTPSERTSVGIVGEHRYFGESHSVTLQYRTPRSSWRYVDSKDVSTSTGRPGYGSTTLFEQFAAVEPDPARREALIRQLGADPYAQLRVGFLTSALSVQRSQNFGADYSGLRDTVSLNLYRTSTRRLDRTSERSDDLGITDHVRQYGGSLGWRHRLTPTMSLGATATLTRTQGEEGLPASDERRADLVWSDAVGRRTSVAAGLRYSRYDGRFGGGQNEAAAYASVSFRF